MKKQTTVRLTKAANDWLTEQAKQRGISKNNVIQELINVNMSAALDTRRRKR